MNLKKLRIANMKTQEEVAKATGITRFTYSNYEVCKTQADYETLIKLADYFHTTVDNLLGHEVPYLLDKSILSEKQKVIIELLPKMSDKICEKTEAYIYGLLEGEKERLATIQKFKS